MDVIEEILTRLDVEDLLRCKNVCKSWYDLISSTFFVKAHLKRRYINNREHGYLRIACLLEHNMIGSCDGLVCIFPFDTKKLLVINPSTRKVRTLTMLPYMDRLKVCCLSLGFGYDSLTDDYKVVVGFNESKLHMRFQVLSLKSNQWKFVGDKYNLTYIIDHRDPGILYDGVLYWFVYDTKEKKRVILSFNLSLEKFKEILLPNDTEYVWDNQDKLGTFEDCLCIFRFYYSNTKRTQIWAMKNYDCWQLISPDYEGNKYVAACLLDFVPNNTWCLNGYREVNLDVSSQIWCQISGRLFVKSLVSPYLCEKPNKKKRKAHKMNDKI